MEHATSARTRHNDEAQYSELVTVVILSAFVPTLVAQQLFQPRIALSNDVVEEEEAQGEEDVAIARPHVAKIDSAHTDSRDGLDEAEPSINTHRSERVGD